MSLYPRDYLKPGPEHRAAYGDLTQGRARDSSHASRSLPGSLQLWGADRQMLLVSRHMHPLSPALSHNRIRVVAKLTTTSTPKQSLFRFVLFWRQDRSLDTALAVLELSI